MGVESKTMLFQRRMLGLLCALLAPACIIFGFFGADSNLPGWYKSISATFYASSNICMIGLLFCTAVFFACYHGYDWRDRLLSAIQSLGALGIIVFPCRTPGVPERVGIFQLSVDTSHVLHSVFASVLFLAFAVNIFFLFTLGNSNTEQKKRRNLVYRICGVVIFAFCVIQAVEIAFFKSYIPQWFPLTWLNEFVMLEAFAVAWLVKVEAIAALNDD